MPRQRTKTVAETNRAERRFAAVYIRVSTPGQTDGVSLDIQLEKCLAYCAALGLRVRPEHVYRETYTGTKFFPRPALTALREGMARGDFQVVVVFNIDRLTRNEDHLSYMFVEAEKHGVSIEFATEKIEDSEYGMLIRHIKAFGSRMEHRSITVRTQGGRVRRSTHAGVALRGRVAKYGYLFQPTDEKRRLLPTEGAQGGYLVHPDQARVVRRIFLEKIAGTPVATIARGLARDGIPSPSGRPYWPVCTVYSFLGDEVYMGRFVAFTRTAYVPESPVYERPDPCVLAVPALVTPEEFAAAQAALARGTRLAARNNRRPADFLLRALVRCAASGRTMTAGHTNEGAPIYRCTPPAGRPNREGEPCPRPHQVSAPLLDDEVWGRFVFTMSSPPRLLAALTRVLSEAPALDNLGTVEAALRAAEEDAVHYGARVVDERDADLRELARLKWEQAKAAALAHREQREALLCQQSALVETLRGIPDLAEAARLMARDYADLAPAERRPEVEGLGVVVTVAPVDLRGDVTVRRAKLRAAVTAEALSLPLLSEGSLKSYPPQSIPLPLQAA